MAAGSGGSLLTGKRLQNQNVFKGDARDLPIHDHVTRLTITEDKDAIVTCLSSQVYDLVTRRDHVMPLAAIDYLDDLFTIDLIVLRQQLGADAVQQLDIVGGARKLHSLATAVHSKVSSLTKEQFSSIYHHYLIWTGLPIVFEDCYRQLIANDITALHVCYLLGVATLERALGNLYLILSNARQCPSLLRDLLTTTELQQCLGAELMYCLQCLIGPPSGLNLRNLIWHGFPYPGEIPIEFGYLLLVLVATIGRILVQNKGEGLIHREYLTMTHDDIIKEYCDDITAEMSKDDLIGLIGRSHLVLPSKRPVWYKAIKEYYNGHYHICTTLLLSELEHAVRRVFVGVNNCPHRLLTAESTQLYTTFDEMMVRSLEDGRPNALVKELGTPYMEMLLDLLIHPEGPRLRDRISHGEVNVYHLSTTMAAHVITVAMALCDCYCTSSTKWSNKMSNYCSIFHPLAILRRELLTLINALHPLYDIHLVDLPKSVAVQEAIKCVGDSERVVALVLQQQLVKGGAIADDVSHDSLDLHMIQLVIQEKWFHLVRTLFVSRDTLETTGILRRCVQNCHTAILQVEAMLTLRQEQLEKKMLRSRQRANFELLQESCMVYADVSKLLVGMVMIEITRSHHLDHHAIIKNLKKILQFTENFSSLTSPSKNRWDVVNSLCVDCANKMTTLPQLIT